MQRSVYPLLNIARGDDYYEMLWNMLRIIQVLEINDADVLDTVSSLWDEPDQVRQYFYATIIGVMKSGAAKAPEGEGGGEAKTE